MKLIAIPIVTMSNYYYYAACGKADANLKACKLVKYYGRDCQVAYQMAVESFDEKLYGESLSPAECSV